jgi:NADH-quinone oxidoreductase subunit N
VIAAFQRNNEFSAESGLKYFILGALSSGLLLFGESIVYGFTGITNFEELSKLFTFDSLTLDTLFQPEIAQVNASPILAMTDLFSYANGVRMGLLFMLVAFLFKIGAVPFHM